MQLLVFPCWSEVQLDALTRHDEPSDNNYEIRQLLRGQPLLTIDCFLKRRGYRLPSAHAGADAQHGGKQICLRNKAGDEIQIIFTICSTLLVCCLTEASTTPTLETNDDKHTALHVHRQPNIDLASVVPQHIMLRWKNGRSLHGWNTCSDKCMKVHSRKHHGYVSEHWCSLNKDYVTFREQRGEHRQHYNANKGRLTEIKLMEKHSVCFAPII